MGIMPHNTITAAGIAWRVADVRHWDGRDDSSRSAAWIDAVDAETGERLESVTIGRVTRSASMMEAKVWSQSPGEIRVYNDMGFPPATWEKLRAELEPQLAAYAVPLTREECMAQILNTVTKYGASGVKQAMRDYSGKYNKRQTDRPGGIDLLELTPAEVAQLRGAWATVFDSILEQVATIH